MIVRASRARFLLTEKPNKDATRNKTASKEMGSISLSLKDKFLNDSMERANLSGNPKISFSIIDSPGLNIWKASKGRE